MTIGSNSTPPAGWHPDPAGSGRARWWDGVRWTDHYSDAPAQAAQTGMLGVSPYGADATPYGADPALATAPAGTSPFTPYIWLLAVLPVVDLVISIYNLLTTDLRAVVADAVAAETTTSPFTTTPMQLGSYAITLLLFALAVVFAVLDWRALNRAGVPRPFHWAWIFFMLVNAPVYMIGRSVIVRRRLGAGLAPMFVNLTLIAANVAIGIVLTVTIVGQTFDTLNK